MAVDVENSGEWMETSEECQAASLFLGKVVSRLPPESIGSDGYLAGCNSYKLCTESWSQVINTFESKSVYLQNLQPCEPDFLPFLQPCNVSLWL